MLTATRTQTPELLRDLRNWHPSHDDSMSGCAGLASCFKHSETALSDKCRAGVIDLLDQALDLIAEDQIEQQSEQAWIDRSPSQMRSFFVSMGDSA